MVTMNEAPPDVPDEERAQLRVLLEDGMHSGPGSELDEAYFERLRERIRSPAEG